MNLNKHKHVFHEFRTIEENNTRMLLSLQKFQYQIKRESDKTIAEIFSKALENKQEKEQLKKRLIAAYQRQTKNKKLQAELEL
jgi:hypothetical protein